jgi:hypothetical protein
MQQLCCEKVKLEIKKLYLLVYYMQRILQSYLFNQQFNNSLTLLHNHFPIEVRSD